MLIDSPFGKIVRAHNVRPLEKTISPASIHTLNHENAVVLKKFMDCRPNHYAISRLLFSEIAVLWLVTPDEEIKFALEEMVHVKNETIRLPSPRNFDADYFWLPRIGHPSLIGSPWKARIAGEIYFDTSPTRNHWVITNQSGRYGVNCGRTEEQLKAAAARFAEYGIELNPFFMERRA